MKTLNRPKYKLPAVKLLDKTLKQSRRVLRAESKIDSRYEFAGAFKVWFEKLGLPKDRVSRTFIRLEIDKVLKDMGYR